MKRSLLGPLVTAVSILTFHLTMTGLNADSLYHVFVNADNSQRIELVNTLSRTMNEQEITDSLYHCDKSTKGTQIEALMHYLMAEHYYDQGQFETAMQEAQQAQALIQKQDASKFKSDVLGVLSNSFFRTGDYNEALKTLLMAYQVDKKLDNKELISSDLNSLAAIYLAVEQPLPGIHFIEQAVALERELNRPDRLATRLGIASELYLMNNEPDKAMDAIQEAYEIEKQGGRTDKAAIRQIQKGAVLEALSQIDDARRVIMSALPELEKAGNTYSMAVAYNQLGSIEQKAGHTQEALAHYKKALELSIRCGAPKVERSAERGLWLMMRDSNPSVALIHLERYTSLTDSLYNKTKSVKMQVMETTVEDIEQSESVLVKNNELIKKMIKWGGLALILMMAALLVGVYYSWRRGKRTLALQRETEEMRAHFFTNITNELQTPLTVMLNAGDELLRGGKANLNENKRIGNLIVRHGKNMLGLVNQLLDIEQIGKAIIQPDEKQGDIVMYVRQLVDNFTTTAHEQTINLEFFSPTPTLTVTFIPEYIRKIVHSLIANAIRYTSRNGSITVNLTNIENGRMRLTVSDTGKGIPANERDRIFRPFSQSVNGDEGVGTSVDLSLVKQLVDAMDGTITVESETGKGTSFIIDFPVHQNDNNGNHNDESLEKNTDKGKHKPHVFIVENNDDVAQFIGRLMRDEYDLRFAGDGREALNNARDLVPDLVITNILMPVMDGKTLMRQLRGTPSLSHIPIIALTSTMGDHERLECIEAGADTVLVKPFNSSELLLVAKHLIKQRTTLRDRVVKTTDTSVDDTIANLSKADKEFINRLIDVIHAQMAKGDIDIEHIAAAMSLSTKQLRNRVMTLTGLTPVAYILYVRLNYARRIIVSENISLTEVASKCGFQNLSHFSKAFKNQFGISPMQFRKHADNYDRPIPKN